MIEGTTTDISNEVLVSESQQEEGRIISLVRLCRGNTEASKGSLIQLEWRSIQVLEVGKISRRPNKSFLEAELGKMTDSR